MPRRRTAQWLERENLHQRDDTRREPERDVTARTHNDPILRLQRTVGNRATQNLIAQGRLLPAMRNTQSGLPVHVQATPAEQTEIALNPTIQKSAFQRRTDPVIQRGWFSKATSWVGKTAKGAWNATKEGVTKAVDWVGDKAKAAWGGIKAGASAAWDALSDGAKAAWKGVVKVATAAGGLANDAWEGLMSLGENAWRQLSAASAKVWEGIKWFGGKSWDIIKKVGVFAWEKLCFYGDVLWSFISKTPIRIWRLIVDAWDGIIGMMSALAESWGGFLIWLGEGLKGAAGWAVDFVSSPSWAKLGQAVKGFVGWLGDGAISAGKWIWDAAKRGASWAGTVLLHVLELVGLNEGLSALWGTVFHLRPLEDPEKTASESIHGSGQIPYKQVWVDEGSVITKINGGRALATMHIIHSPSKGTMTGDLAVHELTHVAQYKQRGSIYMAQAVHAQLWGSNYDYGNLTGRHFSELDPEAQGQLCEDYFKIGGDTASATANTTSKGGTVNSVSKVRSLITEMRAGKY